MKLYGYWRSSASYRVRIALALKGAPYDYIPVNLRQGEQKSQAHLARSQQGYVPVLELEDGSALTQSVAIIDYIDNALPGPNLIPKDPLLRAKILGAALVISSDTAPLQNLTVLKKIQSEYDLNEASSRDWAAHWIAEGLTALEALARRRTTQYLYTETPSLFEACLIPQIYNARRFDVDIRKFPALADIDDRCRMLEPFITAAPEAQIDAPSKT